MAAPLFARVSEHLPHPLADGDLWEKLDALADMHQISGRCIVGQVGYPDKARCEELTESQAGLNAGVPCKRSLAGKAA